MQDFPLFFTAGVHPHNAKDCDDNTLSALRQLAGHERCVAIGRAVLRQAAVETRRPASSFSFKGP